MPPQTSDPKFPLKSKVQFPLKLREIPDLDLPMTRWGCR
ncbi:hypothetical protein SAMN05216215_104338 [Saccharopolyspora shandongensis]|uniref:Uncharacterized protein n=1 Tax=Saccharopolyspora shandongensis TaxID=418495 RepID=A0A1H3PQB3_9PSEU|nr:hypothetical protein SAMN05216215_104338 [Saccharopolyspora shandongensis]